MNRERGEIGVEIGGKPYILKLSMNAICEMEAASGRTFDHMLAKMRLGSATDCRIMFWAALQAHHKGLTLLDVGDLMDQAGSSLADGLKPLNELLEQLVRLNTDEAPTAKPGNPQPADPGGTGVASMSTPVGSA